MTKQQHRFVMALDMIAYFGESDRSFRFLSDHFFIFFFVPAVLP